MTDKSDKLMKFAWGTSFQRQNWPQTKMYASYETIFLRSSSSPFTGCDPIVSESFKSLMASEAAFGIAYRNFHFWGEFETSTTAFGTAFYESEWLEKHKNTSWHFNKVKTNLTMGLTELRRRFQPSGSTPIKGNCQDWTHAFLRFSRVWRPPGHPKWPKYVTIKL